MNILFLHIMNYIDLFAGAGGLSEGFTKAGFNPIAHVESDKAACFTLMTRLAYYYLSSKNQLDIYNSYLKGEISRDYLYGLLPESISKSVINKYISSDNNIDIFAQIDKLLGENEVDLIIGGPPCQAYSNIGRAALKHVTDDPRKKLYIGYGSFLSHYRPKLFVFENVPGLKSSDEGIHYQNIKSYFKELGYVVDDKLLNSLDFGVIQNRKRLIIIGWREDINFNYPEFEIEENDEYKKIIQKVVQTCFETEKLMNTNLYLNVILTNPETIRATNKHYREIDKETDVLSFPMFQKEELDKLVEESQTKKEIVEDVLGDIMISIPRVIEQANEYGHSVERELAYMVVHGFYHVMGYDHIKEEDKAIMRPKEEYVLSKLNITR